MMLVGAIMVAERKVSMKFTVPLSLLVVGAYVATTAELSRAADTIYRSRDFERASEEMTSCPGYRLVPEWAEGGNRRPELKYLMWSKSGVFWSGAWSTTASDFTWMIMAKPTGAKSSHIDLHYETAKPEEIEEVWQLIEECAKRR